MPTLADFRTDAKSWWCPGCGDFAVLASLQRALVNEGVNPHNVAMVAGIGCSGKIGNYINCYNFHVVHGRTLPTAMGLKLANRDLTVLAAGGDGDGFAIGMGHFMHAVRRNPDITYIVMDNHIYGLTKGQHSPTSDPGFQTRVQPRGNIERPVRPLQLALAAGATFVAQGFSSNVKQLTSLIQQGMQHKGFAFINALSPCVTFNKVNTYDWYREVLTDLDADENYDASNRMQALQTVTEHEELVTGLIYKEDTPSYEALYDGFRDTPIVDQEWNIDERQFEELLAEFR